MSSPRKKLSADYDAGGESFYDSFYFKGRGFTISIGGGRDRTKDPFQYLGQGVEYPVRDADGALNYTGMGMVYKKFPVNPASSHPIRELILCIHDPGSPTSPHLQFNLILKDSDLAGKCRKVFEINKIKMMELTKTEVFRFTDYTELKRAFEILNVGKVLNQEDIDSYLQDMDKFLMGRNLIPQNSLDAFVNRCVIL